MTDTKCEPPEEWHLTPAEYVPPNVVADDLLGALTDLAHNPTADATIINTLRRARANVLTFTSPDTVRALVEALEQIERIGFYGASDIARAALARAKAEGLA